MPHATQPSPAQPSPAQPSPAQPIIAARAKNQVICTTGVGNKGAFSCLISDHIPDIQLMFNGQAFPRYTYRPIESSAPQEWATRGASVA